MENIQVLPLLAMRGIVAFPKTTISFDVVRNFSLRAVKEAMSGDKRIFLVTQKEVSTERPSYIDLYKIGVVARPGNFPAKRCYKNYDRGTLPCKTL